MKDEKPKYQEYILISSNEKCCSYYLRLPETFSFVESDIINTYVRNIHGDLIVKETQKICWRKMCKLPGES